MMHYFVDTCKAYPQIAVFLALAIGYYVGKIKIFGFTLGSTAGVLLSAIVIGQMDITVPPMAKAIGFALFIFCIGYKVGPQFFGAMKKEGLKYIVLSLFVAIVGLATAVILGKTLGFDKGTAAGLISGAMTQSSIIGTADGAISHLAISQAQKTALEGNVAIAYAITYIFGVAGLIVFYKIFPSILKVNLKDEARKLEQEMSGGSAEELAPGLFSWSGRLSLRVYRAKHENVIGRTVRDLEEMFPGRVAADKIKRGDKVFDPEPTTVIEADDKIALIGSREEFVKVGTMIGPEIEDKTVSEIIGEMLDICVLNKEVVGKTLGQLSEKHGHGCFLRKILRQGHEIPITRDTVINKCDVLKIAGTQKDVEKLVKEVGYPERPTNTTDLVMVGAGCVLGTLLGLLAVKVGDIPLTLGIGGGVLLAGLVAGWLRSLHPTFGQIPTSAQWIFTDFGLSLFIACVGLTAGPKAVEAIKTTGISLFLAGVVLTITPHILGYFFGRGVLRLNPLLTMGALTGAGTATPSLNVLKDEADSSMPALGYTVPYAFGNFILTVWGTVIIHLM